MAIGFGVSLNGYHFEDWNFTYNLAAGITAADIGKAVTLSTTAPNTVRLSGDNDPIYGRLETVENRVQEGVLVGTVALKFCGTLPIATGHGITVGSMVQGAATAGTVKNRAAVAGSADIHDARCRVVEVIGTTHVVVVKE